MAFDAKRDLYILVADVHIRRTVEVLLRLRQQAIGIRDIDFDVAHHPRHDPGCRTEAVEALRRFQRRYQNAMVMFDYQGSGSRLAAIDLEEQLETALESSGWAEGCVAVVVIEPELEGWLFGGTLQHLENAVSWQRFQEPTLRRWLADSGHWPVGLEKPAAPKAAMESLLGTLKKPLSSDLFAEVAGRASLARCQDRAFQKFRDTLQRWFPVW